MRPLIAIVGPTASGKSELAVELARALGGEVVSMDALQIYRGMDVGTGKITEKEMRGVPHHLLDIAEPDEAFSVQRFQTLARDAVEDIFSRGKTPILCGGTGLFVHSVLYEMDFASASTDEEFRREMEALARDEGNAALHARLFAVDPKSAAAIHPNNVKRVIRALEVQHLTGRAMSELDQGSFSAPKARYEPLLYYGIRWDREILRQRIRARVDRMMEAGLTEEVRALLARGLRPDTHPALQALGYKQLARAMLTGGDQAQAVERIKIETGQFAKRQMSWFNRETLGWLEGETGREAMARRILEAYNGWIG